MTICWGKVMADISHGESISAAGYRHVELTVDSIMGLSTEQFAGVKQQFHDFHLLAEVCSEPLPREVRVTEMGFNIYVWTEYLKKAVRRMAELGCTKLAWNNGRARVMPFEGDVLAVKEQVLQFLYLLCDIAEEYGITVLVEPLGPRRTNFLNTMTEMKNFLDRVGKDNLASMISFRELTEINLQIEDIDVFASLIKYVHLENPADQVGARIAPHPQDGVDYLPFLTALKNCGYSGMICLPQDAEDSSLSYCRQLWKELS